MTEKERAAYLAGWREALLACLETTVPKEGAAWSREALSVMNIIHDRIAALSTPQNPGDAEAQEGEQ